MEIMDFIVSKIEESRLSITHMEGDLQVILDRKKNLAFEMEHLRDCIMEKQSEALFRPQELEENIQLENLISEDVSLDNMMVDLKKRLSKEKEQLGLFQKTLNYIREAERKNTGKVKNTGKIKNVPLFSQLQTVKESLIFAKKICLSDTRRCMMEIDKINYQIDKILGELH